MKANQLNHNNKTQKYNWLHVFILHLLSVDTVNKKKLKITKKGIFFLIYLSFKSMRTEQCPAVIRNVLEIKEAPQRWTLKIKIKYFKNLSNSIVHVLFSFSSDLLSLHNCTFKQHYWKNMEYNLERYLKQ